MEEKYMVSRDGKQSGPYSIQAITNGIKSGKVQKSDHVWKERMSEWEPITSISHFSAVFPKLTLPPPPPSIQTASASSPKKQAITKKIAIKDFEEEEEIFSEQIEDENPQTFFNSKILTSKIIVADD